jgi:hypothetical protein
MAAGQSGDWLISPIMEAGITKVRVFSWDGNEVLLGDFNPSSSVRLPNGLLVVGIANGRIVPCDIDWFTLFNRAPFVYSEDVDMQIQSGLKIGVVRQMKVKSEKRRDITDYFNRLIKEIKVLGLGKIVFRKGGTIQIPEFFNEWCRQNGVTIEIIDGPELDNLYPIDNNIPIDIFIQPLE